MDVIEGETLEALENFDVSIAHAWMAHCQAVGKDLWDDPEEPDSWLRGWSHTDRRYVRCEFATIKLLPPGGMHRGDTAVFPERIEDRPMLRNVVFERCKSANAELLASGAVLDDVTLSDWKADLRLDLCALRHVRLVGRFPQIYVNRSVAFDRQWDRPHRLGHIERVDEQNRQVHEAADWVLDISEAFSRDIDIFELPTEKVRVDPLRQAFVTGRSLAPARAWIDALAGDLSLARRIVRLDRSPDRPTLITTTPRGAQEAVEADLIAQLTADGLVLPTAPPPDPT